MTKTYKIFTSHDTVQGYKLQPWVAVTGAWLGMFCLFVNLLKKCKLNRGSVYGWPWTGIVRLLKDV